MQILYLQKNLHSGIFTIYGVPLF